MFRSVLVAVTLAPRADRAVLARVARLPLRPRARLVLVHAIPAVSRAARRSIAADADRLIHAAAAALTRQASIRWPNHSDTAASSSGLQKT